MYHNKLQARVTGKSQESQGQTTRKFPSAERDSRHDKTSNQMYTYTRIVNMASSGQWFESMIDYTTVQYNETILVHYYISQIIQSSHQLMASGPDGI